MGQTPPERNRTVKVKDMYPDKWLKAEHLINRSHLVTIEKVTVESLFNPEARKHERKFVLHFFKAKLPMVINKTQAFSLLRITGEEDSDKWIGYQIILSPATTPNGKDTILISRPPDRPAETPPAVTAPAESPSA